ncbi:hypothetical protein [Bacteroides sp.]|uniref:hypothetical protein n=1 Tax=Bacteroides sp. TaxID=29523 RepID=UPI00260DC854|nr:hypothetical protein [Bacteroides sp.]MDD3040560.1 hypothetical protein [Bacteroides sp.]
MAEDMQQILEIALQESRYRSNTGYVFDPLSGTIIKTSGYNTTEQAIYKPVNAGTMSNLRIPIHSKCRPVYNSIGLYQGFTRNGDAENPLIEVLH